MANLTITNTFAAGTTASSSQVNTNFSDVKTWLNNRDNATDFWLNMKVSATASNPGEIKSSSTDCEFDIDCTGTNGTPRISWRRSGTTYFTAGVDGAASNLLKMGTTALTTNVAWQIPTAGLQTQFASGAVGAPSIAFISEPASGIYRAAANDYGFSVNGSLTQEWDTADVTFYKKILPSSDDGVDIGKTNQRWQHIYMGDGLIGSPSFTFGSDPDCGFWRAGTNEVALSTGGTRVFDTDTSVCDFGRDVRPLVDNTYHCGNTGRRWVDLWAANGTVQTSISSSKINIQPIDDTSIKVPQAITFNRPEDVHSSPQLGFVADDLPLECFAVIDDQGTRSMTDVYTSSVIGILCAAYNKLESRMTKAGL